MKFPNGDVYNGEFDEDGLMSGSGTIDYMNGDQYSGDFVEGLMHGAGKMKFNNGAVYVGEFKNDLLHGDGEYTFPNGSVYQGQFMEGLMHGLGILEHVGQPSKFGYWVDGEYQGTEKPKDLEITKETLAQAAAEMQTGLDLIEEENEVLPEM
jgi:hypothetical protein